MTATVTDDGSVVGVVLTYDAGGGSVEVSMLDDGAHGDGDADDGVYGEQLPAQSNGTTVTYFLTATDDHGSVTTDPSGAPTVTYSYQVGYTPPWLFINELMADNDTTIEDPDEAGAYDDWVEIYNGGDTTVELGGMYLTDDAEDPTQWQIPAGVTIGPGAYLLFWADNDEDQGDTHTNFKLSSDGEYIGLYDTDNKDNAVIDSVAFGAQTTDISFGRCPDGGDDWALFDAPTPGNENVCGSSSLTFIPAAGFASGTGGSFWVTDVDVNNAGSATMTYSFWWLPRGEDNSQPTMSEPVTLGPGHERSLCQFPGRGLRSRLGRLTVRRHRHLSFQLRCAVHGPHLQPGRGRAGRHLRPGLARCRSGQPDHGRRHTAHHLHERK